MLSKILLAFLYLASLSLAQQGAICNQYNECALGCCGADGKCGFGPSFCGTGCLSGCDAVPECGNGAPEGSKECFAGACCSAQGFCGIGPDFCNNCQNEGGCSVSPKTCDASTTGAVGLGVRVGYYQASAASRTCNPLQPEYLPAGILTHVNVGYENINANGTITDVNGPVMARMARLRRRYTGLRVNLALGGWDFNDPSKHNDDPEALYRWSKMVSTVPNQIAYINSLVDYMLKYALDGVDIDWRYPGNVDRGGTIINLGGNIQDYTNFVVFVANVREAFSAANGRWQVTVSVPYDYPNLKGFSLNRLERHVDWFNVQAYDMYGLWQRDIRGDGFVRPHANISTVANTLDLFVRNGVAPDKIVLGMGFHGTSYTLDDVQCTNPGCRFIAPGFPGDCTNDSGFLSYAEVMDMVPQLGSETHYDKPSASKWLVYSLSQWISYDDAESFADKTAFLVSRCLRGWAVWSLDLDTHDFQGMTALVGERAMMDAIIEDQLNPDERKQLVHDLAAYTGQECFVSTGCTDGTNNNGPPATCPAGYTSVGTGHYPLQIRRGFGTQIAECPQGQWHHVCCPSDAMPRNCKWSGAPEQSEFGCDRGCDAGQFELTRDSFVTAAGGSCFSGERSLCCDKAEILDKCRWTNCMVGGASGPIQCNEGETEVAHRFDEDNGDLCPEYRFNPDPRFTQNGVRLFCCPQAETPKNCKWSDDASRFPGDTDPNNVGHGVGICAQINCPSDELVFARAIRPDPLQGYLSNGLQSCANFGDPKSWPGLMPEFHLCCEPPSIYTREWPVLPSYLWSDTQDNRSDDVTWQWANDFGNNDHDIIPHNLDEEPGKDPYGFVVLDGPPGSIHNAFPDAFTVVQNNPPPANLKARSLLTTNRTVLDQVYDHAEETIRVFCNYPGDSPQCRQVFFKGAKDTIIRLPPHVGEGPWARIVSMDAESTLHGRAADSDLPGWVKQKRELSGTSNNAIYHVKIDYNFHLIQRRDNETVKMRIDFTNLQGYWDAITNASVGSTSTGRNFRKRDVDDHFSFAEWKSHVDRAKKRDENTNLDESQEVSMPLAVQTTPTVQKRWWGAFVDWLAKLTTIERQEQGVLPMVFARYFNLFSGRLVCKSDTGLTFTAGLDVTADLQLQMNTRYSYYFSGTVVPPAVHDMYAFARTQPSVTAGITLAGDASLGYATEPKKLITTLTYPGLAIKGLAAVGPSLDIWGQLDGSVTVSGDMRAGVTYTFKPIEMYLPNDDETRNRAEKDLNGTSIDQEGISPTFEANVRASVDFNVRVSPEVNMGIQVGGKIGPFDGLLVDAHVSAFVNTTLNFNAHASAGTVNSNYNWEYNYELAFLYRVGLAALAQIRFYGEWRSRTYYPVDWQKIKLWGPDEPIRSGVLSPPVNPTSSSKKVRRGSSLRHLYAWSDSGLPDPIFAAPLPPPFLRSASSNSDLLLSSGASAPDPSSFMVSTRQTEPQSTSEDDKKADLEFKIGGNTFKCNSAPATCGQVTANALVQSRSFSPSLLADNHTASGARPIGNRGLWKRVNGDDCAILPRLYYNCHTAFNDYTLTAPQSSGGTGVADTMQGICTTLNNYIDQYTRVTVARPGQAGRSICDGTTRGCTLTYDGEKANVDRRRGQACPDLFCRPDNDARETRLFGGVVAGRRPAGGITSCDEFPFASSEEGGHNYDVDGARWESIFDTQRVCVPVWQQTLQGQCNQLVGNLETNIRYYNNYNADGSKDPKPPPANPEIWKSWNSRNEPGWAQAGWRDPVDPQNQNMQRRAEYEWGVERPVGFTMQDWTNTRQHIGWAHKRNYTVMMANFVDGAMNFPGTDGTFTATLASDNTPIALLESVLCAVFPMEQQRFRVRAGGWNALCQDPNPASATAPGVSRWAWSTRRPNYRRCNVRFTRALTRRSGEEEKPIGMVGGVPIYGIEMWKPSPGYQDDFCLEELP